MVGLRGTTGARVCYTWTTGEVVVSFGDESDSMILCDKISSAERLIVNHVCCLGYLFRSLDYFQCSKAKASFETNEMQHLTGFKMETLIIRLQLQSNALWSNSTSMPLSSRSLTISISPLDIALYKTPDQMSAPWALGSAP